MKKSRLLIALAGLTLRQQAASRSYRKMLHIMQTMRRISVQTV